MPTITLNVTDEQLATLNARVAARGRGETVETLLLRRFGDPGILNQLQQKDMADRQASRLAERGVRQAERQAERSVRLQGRLDAIKGGSGPVKVK